MPHFRRGKIARRPFALREEINRRLLDNDDGPKIIAWINAEAGLTGSARVTLINLSVWRGEGGGFEKWLEKQDQVTRTKEFAEFSLRLAQAGGGAMNLPAAITGGHIMEALESNDPAELKALLKDKPETYIGLLDKLAKLHKAKAEADRTKVTERQNDQRSVTRVPLAANA